MTDDEVGSVLGCGLMVVILAIVLGLAAYTHHQHSIGIHAGRIVEHGHENPSTTIGYAPSVGRSGGVLTTDPVPEKWWVVIESAGQRNRFEMDRYDWEAVKVGDYVRFEGDRFCGVEKGECE